MQNGAAVAEVVDFQNGRKRPMPESSEGKTALIPKETQRRLQRVNSQLEDLELALRPISDNPEHKNQLTYLIEQADLSILVVGTLLSQVFYMS